MEDADRRLHTALGEVHELLEQASELNAEDRSELRATLREIQAALSEDGDDGGDGNSDSGSIGARLRASVEHFEDRHPRLTELIGRIADSLAELGI